MNQRVSLDVSKLGIPLGYGVLRMHCHTFLSFALASDDKRGRPESHTKRGSKSAQGLWTHMEDDQCKDCELQADMMEKR